MARALILTAAVLAAACSSSSATQEPGAATEGTAPVAAPTTTQPPSPAPVAAPTPDAPATTLAPLRSFTLAATGDLLVHDPVADRARANAGGSGWDFGPMLAQVAPILSEADLALCHLETPLAREGGRLSYYPVFNVPGPLAAAVAGAGYDGCSTASNHALDRGADGVASTLEHLDAAGLGHVGTARSQAEADARRLYLAGGVRVGHLSYTYGFNGFTVPADAPWLSEPLDVPTAVGDAERLRAAGAEFVIVSLHWGVEYRSEPTPEQILTATALLASPAIDLLVGHHAHVVQPIARIGPELVAYGLGNFLSNQSAACCPAASQDGMILSAMVTERRSGGFEVALSYVPTMVERGSYRVLPVAAALADPATPPGLRTDLEASWERTTAVVESLGAGAPVTTAMPGATA